MAEVMANRAGGALAWAVAGAALGPAAGPLPAGADRPHPGRDRGPRGPGAWPTPCTPSPTATTSRWPARASISCSSAWTSTWRWPPACRAPSAAAVSALRAPSVTTVEVFAVEDRSVQLAWACLPAPGMTIEVGGPAASRWAARRRRGTGGPAGRPRRAGARRPWGGDDHRSRAGHDLRRLPERARPAPRPGGHRHHPGRRRRGGSWPGSRPSATATSASSGSARSGRLHDPRPRPPGSGRLSRCVVPGPPSPKPKPGARSCWSPRAI